MCGYLLLELDINNKSIYIIKIMNKINGVVNFTIFNKLFYIYKIDIKSNSIYKFKNENLHINNIIDYIKDNIIKNYPNLNNIKIKIELFNKNSPIHKFIIDIINRLNINLYQYDRLILIYIYNNDDIIFVGNF